MNEVCLLIAASATGRALKDHRRAPEAAASVATRPGRAVLRRAPVPWGCRNQHTTRLRHPGMRRAAPQRSVAPGISRHRRQPHSGRGHATTPAEANPTTHPLEDVQEPVHQVAGGSAQRRHIVPHQQQPDREELNADHRQEPEETQDDEQDAQRDAHRPCTGSVQPVQQPMAARRRKMLEPLIGLVQGINSSGPVSLHGSMLGNGTLRNCRHRPCHPHRSRATSASDTHASPTGRRRAATICVRNAQKKNPRPLS